MLTTLTASTLSLALGECPLKALHPTTTTSLELSTCSRELRGCFFAQDREKLCRLHAIFCALSGHCDWALFGYQQLVPSGACQALYAIDKHFADNACLSTPSHLELPRKPIFGHCIRSRATACRIRFKQPVGAFVVAPEPAPLAWPTRALVRQ